MFRGWWVDLFLKDNHIRYGSCCGRNNHGHSFYIKETKLELNNPFQLLAGIVEIMQPFANTIDRNYSVLRMRVIIPQSSSHSNELFEMKWSKDSHIDDVV